MQRNKAKIQISKGIEKLGAVVSNDNAISYQVPYYEQGMLHSYQALNYLFQHDLEGALVEIRRANLVQENALKAYQGEIYKAKNELYNSGMSTDSIDGRLILVWLRALVKLRMVFKMLLLFTFQVFCMKQAAS